MSKEEVSQHYARYYESVQEALDKKAVLVPLMHLQYDWREGFKATLNRDHPRNAEGASLYHTLSGAHTSFIWRNGIGSEMTVTSTQMASAGYLHIVVLYAEVDKPIITIERFVEGVAPYSEEQAELACAMLGNVFDRLWPTPA